LILYGYYSFEKYYDPVPGITWIQQHPLVPIAACVLYVSMIVAGQAYFANRARWNWRYTLAAWNLFLSVFSFTGMARTLPQLVHNLATMSLRDNLCLDPRSTYGSGSSGLWIQLFIVSKFPYVLFYNLNVLDGTVLHCAVFKKKYDTDSHTLFFLTRSSTLLLSV
jgi:hypothetical protein